jgi:phosphoserine aminotransferase
MARVYNFAAGPATMPEPVLARIREDIPDWRGTGMSILETPFTGQAFRDVAERAEANLRNLLRAPANYRILFLHGGARAQFAMVPLNLLAGRGRADYVETGYWANRAIGEAGRYCRVNIAASGHATGYSRIPPQSEWTLDPAAAYCHITTNETVDGIEFHFVPDTGNVPLVADMTSDFLARPVDVSRFGLIYASAQKNIGPAGLAIVVVRDDLIGSADAHTPGVFDYKVQGESHSRYNTPNTFAIYVADLVFEWLTGQGGLAAMERASLRKRDRLYGVIDSVPFYRSKAEPESRSRMNLCFSLADAALDAAFLTEAQYHGLVNLLGHRAVGGMRASLYNAMPQAGAEALAEFMTDFARRYG